MKILVKLVGEQEGLDTRSLKELIRECFLEVAGGQEKAVDIIQAYWRTPENSEKSKAVKTYITLTEKSVRLASEKYFDAFVSQEIIRKKGLKDFQKQESLYKYLFLDRISHSLFIYLIVRGDLKPLSKKQRQTLQKEKPINSL